MSNDIHGIFWHVITYTYPNLPKPPLQLVYERVITPHVMLIQLLISVLIAMMVYYHWGWVTHICVGKLTIIGSDNGMSPERRQAIIWTNVGILLIGPLGTNFSEILIGIQTFSFKKMHLKMSSAKWRPLCLGLNELINLPKGPWCLH